MRTLFSVDVTILGRRLELEAYTCGALYVRLGGDRGRAWMIREEQAIAKGDMPAPSTNSR